MNNKIKKKKEEEENGQEWLKMCPSSTCLWVSYIFIHKFKMSQKY